MALWDSAGNCGHIGISYKQGTSYKQKVTVSALIGGGVGAWLLLQTPENTFSRAIPWLLLLPTVLLIWGDPLQAALRRRFEGKQSLSALGGVLLALLLLPVYTYGGFFNAGLSIILLGYFSLAGNQDIHLMNGLKLLVWALVSILAIVTFGFGDLIVWRKGAIVLSGSLIGGYAAASAVRVVSQRLVRRAIIAVAGGMTAYFFIAS